MSGLADYVQRFAFENGTSPSFGASAGQWDFQRGSDISKSQPLLDGQGMTGGRNRDVSRTRKGPYSVGGSLTINPSPKFFGAWLPRAMGGGTETAPAMANAIPVFGALLDKGIGANGDGYKYLGLKVNRLVVRGGAGQLLTCTVDVLGKTETIGQSWGGSIPALGTSLAYEPFQFADLTFDAIAASRSLLDFELSIENNLRARWASASLSADEIIEGDRVIRFSGKVAIGASEVAELYGVTKNGATDGSLTIINSTVSTTFTFSRLQIPDNTIRSDNGEIILPVQAEIRGTSFGAEFTVTNDVTP